MRHAWSPAVLVVFLVAAPCLAQQRPHLGLGVGGGLILGSHLLDHTVPLVGDAEPLIAHQRVTLTEISAVGAQGEWFATPHVALRGHVARGAGSLVPTTWADTPGADLTALEGGFGRVAVLAYDVAVSVWPLRPRSQGFAPYFTVGLGSVRFDFSDDAADGDFFLARGIRRIRTTVLGGGADMAVWPSVLLRVEAVNHRTPSPLLPDDFAVATTWEAASHTRSDTVNNVRFSMAAFVYVP